MPHNLWVYPAEYPGVVRLGSRVQPQQPSEWLVERGPGQVHPEMPLCDVRVGGSQPPYLSLSPVRCPHVSVILVRFYDSIISFLCTFT